MSISFTFTVPENLSSHITINKPYVNYTQNDDFSSFGIELELEALDLHKTVKSSDEYVFTKKVNNALAQWSTTWTKYEEKLAKTRQETDVNGLNIVTKATFDALEKILAHTLDVDDAVDWETLYPRDEFEEEVVDYVLYKNLKKYIVLNTNKKPTRFIPIAEPKEPAPLSFLKEPENPDLSEFDESQYGFFAKLFNGKKIANARVQYKTQQIADINAFKSKTKANETSRTKHKKAVDKYDREKSHAMTVNATRKIELADFIGEYDKAVLAHKGAKKAFASKVKDQSDAIEAFKSKYFKKDKQSIHEYCDIVLEASHYPDCIKPNWELEYQPGTNILVVQYDLPAPDDLPQIESYRYVKTRNEVVEKVISKSALKALYDATIYKICIRTIHELFEADIANAIEAIGFNGVVTMRNPATGIEETKTIISVLSRKDEFMAFDLAKVDAKETFKYLKGVSASTLINVTPVPPVIQMEKTDKRFVDSKEVVADVDEKTNLASMHWEEFEHLVRELFEKEFSVNGGEVKVTQGSSDGGVDAIAFDPDPIRGGKIIIQAKRYTNVVGVSAVRDLYGTVLNEGATKGILITTSNYGPDSYTFAKNKPLTLLSGSNLLSMLEKHGHKAMIDIKAAKQIFADIN